MHGITLPGAITLTGTDVVTMLVITKTRIKEVSKEMGVYETMTGAKMN